MPTKSFQPFLFTLARKVSETTADYQATLVAVPTGRGGISPETITKIADDFKATLNPRSLPFFEPRLDRGVKLAIAGSVTHIADRRYQVASGSIKHAHYDVDLDTKTCTCPDSAIEGHACKHRFAAFLVDRALFSPEYLQPTEPKPSQELIELCEAIKGQKALADALWDEQFNAAERFEHFITLWPRNDAALAEARQICIELTEEATTQQKTLNDMRQRAYELYITIYGPIVSDPIAQ